MGSELLWLAHWASLAKCCAVIGLGVSGLSESPGSCCSCLWKCCSTTSCNSALNTGHTAQRHTVDTAYQHRRAVCGTVTDLWTPSKCMTSIKVHSTGGYEMENEWLERCMHAMYLKLKSVLTKRQVFIATVLNVNMKNKIMNTQYITQP